MYPVGADAEAIFAPVGAGRDVSDLSQMWIGHRGILYPTAACTKSGKYGPGGLRCPREAPELVDPSDVSGYDPDSTRVHPVCGAVAQLGER